jgi:hypothetical protein
MVIGIFVCTMSVRLPPNFVPYHVFFAYASLALFSLYALNKLGLVVPPTRDGRDHNLVENGESGSGGARLTLASMFCPPNVLGAFLESSTTPHGGLLLSYA